MQGNDRLPETIGGYRIVRRLAREATVDVLLARGEGARGEGREVVLKLVSPTFRGDASFEQTFVRETQAIAQLDHPNVVRLYDVFSATDVKAMVLEHVDGLSLSELRAALAKRNEAIPDVAAFGIGAALFGALAAAHAARDPQTGNLLPIVHRDIFPGQIQVGRDGAVKLGGFGLERITGVRGDARSPEARGYLPPEKARGEPVTIRSDVYAAAVVIWELLARRRAVRDDALPEQELVRALSQPTIVSLEVLRPDLPSLVRSVISRALEPQIERRAVTAEEAASIFRSAAFGEESRRLIAQGVSHAMVEGGAGAGTGTATDELTRAPEPSLPSFPLASSASSPSSPSSPEFTPFAGSVSERPGPPRPNPRRMWGSSPTFTPSAPVVTPSSTSRGSIPDARLSGAPPEAAPPSAPSTKAPSVAKAPAPISKPPPMPPLSDRPRQPPVSSRTVAGGFTISSLKPLIETPPPSAPSSRPSRPPPRPAPSVRPLPTPEPLFAMPTSGAPPPRGADPLPGMAVPLATGATILDDMSPMPPAVNAPVPPPSSDGIAAFWSSPSTSPAAPTPVPVFALATPFGGPSTPAPVPTMPTVRYAGDSKRKSERASLKTLALGLFLLAAAIGAAGFAWLFRRSVVGPPSSVTASPTPSVRPSVSVTITPPAPSAAPAPSNAIAIAIASSAPSSVASAKPSASAVAPSASATPPTPPTPVVAAAGSEGASADATSGSLRFDRRAVGHRVFIDGRVVGEGEGPYTVACGAHDVRIGSKGKLQKVEVACGNETTVVTK